MKKWYRMLSLGLVMVLLAGCGSSAKTEEGNTEVTSEEAVEETLEPITWDENAAKIELSDDGILVDGEAAALYEGSSDTVPAVYTANDIIFYLEGQGAEYGEGD